MFYSNKSKKIYNSNSHNIKSNFISKIVWTISIAIVLSQCEEFSTMESPAPVKMPKA